MPFVIFVVFINIQLIIDESLSQGFPSQINEGFTKMNVFVYENEYVRNAAICIFVRITQLVEHPAETNQLTFIKRHRAFELSFLFIDNSFIYFFIIACFCFIYIYIYILYIFFFYFM